MKSSIKDFFSKCDQIHSILRICSHLLKKSFMENFIFLCRFYINEKQKDCVSLALTDNLKQPPRCVLSKRCSENMQQIYRRTPMPKCDFNKVAEHLFLRITLGGCFWKMHAHTFSKTFDIHILFSPGF